MSSTRLYPSFVDVGPFRFTGKVTCSIGRLVDGFSTPPHAVAVSGRQNGADTAGGPRVVGLR
jgi:hypothetical protein